MSDEVKNTEFNLTPEELLEKYPLLVIPVQGLLELTDNIGPEAAKKWYEIRTLRYCDKGSWTVSLPDLGNVVSTEILDSLIDALRSAKEHIIARG